MCRTRCPRGGGYLDHRNMRVAGCPPGAAVSIGIALASIFASISFKPKAQRLTSFPQRDAGDNASSSFERVYVVRPWSVNPSSARLSVKMTRIVMHSLVL